MPSPTADFKYCIIVLHSQEVASVRKIILVVFFHKPCGEMAQGSGWPAELPCKQFFKHDTHLCCCCSEISFKINFNYSTYVFKCKSLDCRSKFFRCNQYFQ